MKRRILNKVMKHEGSSTEKKDKRKRNPKGNVTLRGGDYNHPQNVIFFTSMFHILEVKLF